jgi:hypothetical protein
MLGGGRRVYEYVLVELYAAGRGMGVGREMGGRGESCLFVCGRAAHSRRSGTGARRAPNVLLEEAEPWGGVGRGVGVLLSLVERE